jgi:nucleoid-associated protein YgaU
MYNRLFKRRQVKFIAHYETPSYEPSDEDEYADVGVVMHTWSHGDRYSKLADIYYNDPTLWWIIARFNQKPTESHLNLGDTIMIPTDIESTFEFFGI